MMRVASILGLAAVLSALLLQACDRLDPLIAAAEKHVRDSEKDPDSTQFRNVTKCRNGMMVTGEVLGKNSYGAYTGWKKFWANEYSLTVEDDDNYESAKREAGDCGKTPEQWQSDLGDNASNSNVVTGNSAG